jgi:hypothetical protein
LSKRKPEISEEALKELGRVIAVELPDDTPPAKRVSHYGTRLRTIDVPDPTAPRD